MPLPKPTLDSRCFDQLVSECRALLSRAAPGWTDHNASDPGITLLELFAWVGEQNFYRLDRLSDEALRAFVRLLGIEPQPPAVARTVVAIGTMGVAIELPPRVQVGAGPSALFETTSALLVSPAQLKKVVAGAVDFTAANRSAEPFSAFGPRPRPGHALVLGFDRALAPPGATVTLHVWTERWEEDATTRAALMAEHAAPCARPIDWRRHYRVRTLWEYLSSSGAWGSLADVVDETRALTLTGFVHFTAPIDHGTSGPEALSLVRCRIASGRFECAPHLAQVALNAVTCEHALSRAPRDLGRSRGHAGAVFAVGEVPLVAGTTKLVLDDGAGRTMTDWAEVPDWDRAGAHDRVFCVDPEQGLLQSGDGLRGEILPADFHLHAAYRVGGGSAGNVGAGTLTSVPPTAANLALVPQLASLGAPLVVRQPLPATGGNAREPIERAQATAFDAASAIDKAVTIEDIERLALATPGVPVARARAIANMDPLLPCCSAPGVVTLVLIPICPRPAPRPSQALLDAVARYIGARRLVTSEIRTVAPRYRRVSVQAVLYVADDADTQRVVRQARARIDAYFDPITGGVNGSGWPFGRAVYRSDVLALLAATSGVTRVTGLGFVVGYGPVDRPICENVVLCPDELVRPGRHRLLIESQIVRNLQRSEPHDCESH